MAKLPVVFTALRPEHWSWIQKKARPIWCEDTKGLVAIRGGWFVGAAVFDSWTPNSCQGHVIVDDPHITRALYREAFNYVFNQAGRRILIGLTPSNNKKALRLAKGMGFQVIYTLKDGYKDGVDYVVFELRKENCKLLKLPKVSKAA